jgi:hypothetical protein
VTRIPRKSTTGVRMAVASALALVAALGLAVAPACAGPIGLQATGGWYTESEDGFLGVGLRLGLAGITVIPNGEYLFAESGSNYTAYIDGTMNVLTLGVANLYGGGGIGWFIVDPERGDTETDTVYDLMLGAGLDAIPFKPFGQFKWVFADGDDPLAFAFGVKF